MTPASVTGLRIRPAEPAEYDDVRALLLEAYCSRFWITGAYRESLLDIEGHLADGEELLVAEAGGKGAFQTVQNAGYETSALFGETLCR